MEDQKLKKIVIDAIDKACMQVDVDIARSGAFNRKDKEFISHYFEVAVIAVKNDGQDM